MVLVWLLRPPASVYAFLPYSAMTLRAVPVITIFQHRLLMYRARNEQIDCLLSGMQGLIHPALSLEATEVNHRGVAKV